MMIRRMTASFGKLENATLSPAAGLNVFCAPNESGKSTWAAFLTAMLYGIDTGERAKKGVLPDKVKYKPWSGKPMEGTLEVTWQGRNITIQRTSEGRVPMGKFLAFDTDSGEKLDFLTGENCGKTLLGVERSVFLRSAFIGQNALEVSSDPSLEQRLNSLVTTGDETVSYTQTEKRLRDWKNHVRHNRTGYLPEAEEQLRAAEEKLRTIHRTHQESLHLYARRQELTAKKERLSYIEQNLNAADALKKHQQLAQAERELHTAEESLRSVEAAAATLPSAAQLQQFQKDLDILTLRQEMNRGQTKPQEPATPEIPEIFRGLSPEEATRKAAQDAQVLHSLDGYKLPAFLLPCAMALAAAGIALCFLHLVAGILLLIAAGAGTLVFGSLHRAKYTAHAAQQRNAILQRYNANDAESVLLAAAAYGETLNAYEQALAVYRIQFSAWESASDDLSRRQDALFAAVRAFAPSIYSLQDAADAIHAALSAHDKERAARNAKDAAGVTCAALRAAIGDVKAPEMLEDFTQTHTLSQVRQELRQIEQELQSIATTLAQQQGLVQSLGDPAALEAEKQELTETCRTLERRNTALTLAMDVLQEANEALRSRFSPQISNLAGELLGRMTGGKYDGVRLMQDMSMDVHPAGDSVNRQQLSLSGGTADQLYLALRLAICRLTLGQDVPLILDDALVFFDDDRLKAAMALLKEESAHRQILLFTCQQREKDALLQ